MNYRLRFIIPLVIFIGLIGFFWKGMQKDPNLLPSVLINKNMPIFNAPILGDQQHTISDKDFKGHVTVLSVWASWCPECKMQQPLLFDLGKMTNVQIIGLNYKDEPEKALTYLKEAGNPYHKIIFDTKGTYAMQFGVYGTPETFLIDRDGVIRQRYVGALTLDLIDKIIMPTLISLNRGD